MTLSVRSRPLRSAALVLAAAAAATPAFDAPVPAAAAFAAAASPVDADACVAYPAFPPYHEGIEHYAGKGILVGSVFDTPNQISVVRDDGALAPWTDAPKPAHQLGQLGLHVDRDDDARGGDRLLATNLDSAPYAQNAGVLALDASTGGELFYWNGTLHVAGNFTPNDLTACGRGSAANARRNIYVTDHVNGHIVEVVDADTFRVVTTVTENRYTSTLATDGYIVNGIECMATGDGDSMDGNTLLVAFMTPPGTKGKILRVDVASNTYAAVPLPDVPGMPGIYARFDGFYAEDATTLWVTTNTGNRRVLKIVATDPGWTAIRAVYASKPSTCNVGADGPTTGVLVGDAFITSGDNMQSVRKWSLDLVYPASPGGGGGGGEVDAGNGGGDDGATTVALGVSLGVAMLGLFAAGAWIVVLRRRASRAGPDVARFNAM